MGVIYSSSANDILVPPVFPYWLGLGMRILGDDTPILKWWLLPFALLLAGSFRFLALRFAPSLAVPLIWLGAVSTTTLPGFDFMLDVPVLALGMTAVSLAVLATERDSWGWCAAAGLVGGLAIQTKYTGLVPCVTMLAWFVLNRRPVKGLVAFAIAVGLAVGWEFLLVRLQGTSHFGVALGQAERDEPAVQRAWRPISVLPTFSHMAGHGPGDGGSLGLGAARRWSRRSLVAASRRSGVLVGFTRGDRWRRLPPI